MLTCLCPDYGYPTRPNHAEYLAASEGRSSGTPRSYEES